MADDATIRPPAYPGSIHDYQMIFSRAQYGFNVARADNGLIFEEYEIATDTMRRKIATTPEQMQAIFAEWFAARSGSILELARKMMESDG